MSLNNLEEKIKEAFQSTRTKLLCTQKPKKSLWTDTQKSKFWFRVACLMVGVTLSTIAIAAQGGIKHMYDKMVDRDEKQSVEINGYSDDFKYFITLLLSTTEEFEGIYNDNLHEGERSASFMSFAKDDLQEIKREILNPGEEFINWKKATIDFSKSSYKPKETNMKEALKQQRDVFTCYTCQINGNNADNFFRRTETIAVNLELLLRLSNITVGFGDKIGPEARKILTQFNAQATEGIKLLKKKLIPSETFVNNLFVRRILLTRSARNYMNKLKSVEVGENIPR